MILGAVAVAVAIWARRGLWGVVADHAPVRLFPVGYWLWEDGQGPRRLLGRNGEAPGRLLRRPGRYPPG
jgi:hypothetical protein